MTKAEQINRIAQSVGDNCIEIMYDSIEWSISDEPVSGDRYTELHNRVMTKAINYMYKYCKPNRAK